jgi:hypothetical protein
MKQYISKKLLQTLIDKGYKPYIKGHYLTSLTSRSKSGYIISFENKNIEFYCSRKTWENCQGG